MVGLEVERNLRRNPSKPTDFTENTPNLQVKSFYGEFLAS
jgi:hypothetical protein